VRLRREIFKTPNQMYEKKPFSMKYIVSRTTASVRLSKKIFTKPNKKNKPLSVNYTEDIIIEFCNMSPWLEVGSRKQFPSRSQSRIKMMQILNIACSREFGVVFHRLEIKFVQMSGLQVLQIYLSPQFSNLNFTNAEHP
jgi:hypothetical protein